MPEALLIEDMTVKGFVDALMPFRVGSLRDDIDRQSSNGALGFHNTLKENLGKFFIAEGMPSNPHIS